MGHKLTLSRPKPKQSPEATQTPESAKSPNSPPDVKPKASKDKAPEITHPIFRRLTIPGRE